MEIMSCWEAEAYIFMTILGWLCQGKNHVWKWFDDRSGRWTNYGSSNNKSIDDAYREGKSSVRLVLLLLAILQFRWGLGQILLSWLGSIRYGWSGCAENGSD